MKILSIVGARPQFIKVAPLVKSLANYCLREGASIEHSIVHTGQHFDPGMSKNFFEELEIPPPSFNLGVGSGPHGTQTGRMLDKLEQVIPEIGPDLVVVYGDTNSTLAGSLAAAKLQGPVAHVEAGVRSFNRHMPEEVNRVATDHICDLLLAPTPTAMENLEKEGLAQRSVLTGDVMYDVFLHYRHRIEPEPRILKRHRLEPGEYALVTIHRAENTDNEKKLGILLETFNEIAAAGWNLIFPVHPRTAKVLRLKFPQWSAHSRLHLIDPVGYLDMLRLLNHARLILTDSGGLQKEAFFLGCPCITLREETEWVETSVGGGNILTGIDSTRIHNAISTWDNRCRSGGIDFSWNAGGSFGYGEAADRIRDALVGFLLFPLRKTPLQRTSLACNFVPVSS